MERNDDREKTEGGAAEGRMRRKGVGGPDPRTSLMSQGRKLTTTTLVCVLLRKKADILKISRRYSYRRVGGSERRSDCRDG